MPIRIFSLLNTSISTKIISLVFKNNLYLIFNNQYIYSRVMQRSSYFTSSRHCLHITYLYITYYLNILRLSTPSP